ncbi:hypothetical protein ACWFRF_20630 [Nocardia sp. NPDC055165]
MSADPIAEQLTAELAEVYALTGETLDFLVAATTGRNVDPATEFAGIANYLSTSTSERLSAVLAVAIQRLVEADHTKTRLRRRIHRARRTRAALRATLTRQELVS